MHTFFQFPIKGITVNVFFLLFFIPFVLKTMQINILQTLFLCLNLFAQLYNLHTLTKMYLIFFHNTDCMCKSPLCSTVGGLYPDLEAQEVSLSPHL